MLCHDAASLIAAAHSSRTSGSLLARALRGRQVRNAVRRKPLQRPDRRAAHLRLAIVEQPLGLLRKLERRRNCRSRSSTLRTKRAAPDPLDRRAGEEPSERRIVEPRQRLEPRRIQILARGKLRLPALLGELVPRADGEAIVAAIDAVADQRPELARDRPVVLDGEVGDAAPRIEPVGRRKSVGRADVEAGAARAAMVRLRRVGRQLGGR